MRFDSKSGKSRNCSLISPDSQNFDDNCILLDSRASSKRHSVVANSRIRLDWLIIFVNYEDERITQRFFLFFR
ncbi:Uncharacterized protein APZ42_002453 [Daphnia magna]|uniref:Uncharacterized protein n=1 Tax=Daphnia magna TaxID=35525 RepID=A0A164I928_9CRUS|nr:Uncharacterized protein APZ42_002453 [Daphnia magna]